MKLIFGMQLYFNSTIKKKNRRRPALLSYLLDLVAAPDISPLLRILSSNLLSWLAASDWPEVEGELQREGEGTTHNIFNNR